MIFGIGPETVMSGISEALENAGSQLSEEQFIKIVDVIEKGMPGIVKLITAKTAQDWKSAALESGTGWGSKYAGAITYKTDGKTGEVFLDESMIDKMSNKPNIMFAKMVEEGVKSWSIKDALLASEKAKTSSSGIKYMVVPFPVAVPQKPGPARQTGQFGGREMTEEAHKIVKSGGRYSGPLKSGQEISGLTKYTTRQRHEQYGIFRCVTENSKGWQYPNKSERPVFPNVVNEIEKNIHELISAFCKEIVREYSK